MHHRQSTREWWDKYSTEYKLYISDFVIQEISRGDSKAVQRRLNLIEDIPSLEVSEKVFDLANELIKYNVLPEIASLDALHISIAAINQMDYLLSWNCKHIVNACILPRTIKVIEQNGYKCPLIYTTDQFLKYEN
jgi:predicted nucleic acid-binding protein